MKNFFKIGMTAIVVALSVMSCGDQATSGNSNKPDTTEVDSDKADLSKVDSSKLDTAVKGTTSEKKGTLKK